MEVVKKLLDLCPTSTELSVMKSGKAHEAKEEHDDSSIVFKFCCMGNQDTIKMKQ